MHNTTTWNTQHSVITSQCNYHILALIAYHRIMCNWNLNKSGYCCFYRLILAIMANIRMPISQYILDIGDIIIRIEVHRCNEDQSCICFKLIYLIIILVHSTISRILWELNFKENWVLSCSCDESGDHDEYNDHYLPMHIGDIINQTEIYRMEIYLMEQKQ